VKESGSPADTMNPSITPRDQVAEHLTVSTTTLLRLEGRGLIHAVRHGDVEGYGPAEIRRLWTIVTFQRDLGINLAGIEVILRLRDQMKATQYHLDRLAQKLRETLDRETGPDGDD
jgi:MerR family transcriptional regulator, heat shock protein HspR